MEAVKRKAEEIGIELEEFDQASEEPTNIASNRSKSRGRGDPYARADAQYKGNASEDNALLKTIKVPHNLANLSSRLPKSNYEPTIKSEYTRQQAGTADRK